MERPLMGDTRKSFVRKQSSWRQREDFLYRRRLGPQTGMTALTIRFIGFVAFRACAGQLF